MPRKRKGADLSRSTSKARNLRKSRSERTEEQIQQQNTAARVRMAQLHQEEPEDIRAERNEVRRLEQRQSRRFTVNRRRINDQQRQQGSKTVVEEQDQSRQEKQDNIAVEPTIRIKEEPADDYSTPSTSSGTSNGEFILPNVDIPWTTTSPAEESQITLSVACLNSPNVHKSSDGGQQKKKQRTNSSLNTTNASASTSVSASTDVSNHTAIRQQSQAIKDVSTISSSRELCMNRFVTFGNYVANKLNSLDSVSSAYAQKAIERIILEAEMGKYLDQTTQDIKPSIASSSI